MASKRQVHAAATASRRASVQETPAPVVEQVPEEQGLITSSASTLSAWVGNVGAFLTTARTLEAKAGALERTAATFKLPTTATEDAALQQFIQTATATGKEIEGHWTIAKAVHDFHKLLVGYRERGCGKAERAKATAQRLHNAYVDAERRRVEEENRRRQLEAEADARRKRDEEAAALEARALEAEAASADLSEREKRFVEIFATGVVASQAAYRAGYKDTTYAARLCAMPKIQKAVFALKEALAARQQAEAVKAAPLQVATVQEAAPNVVKVGSDRETWRGEITDARAFVAAYKAGTHAIPDDLIVAFVEGRGQGKLTEYARSLRNLMNWPGVRAVRNTSTV